ncbi:unnamed protein product [Lampetra planeri]
MSMCPQSDPYRAPAVEGVVRLVAYRDDPLPDRAPPAPHQPRAVTQAAMPGAQRNGATEAALIPGLSAEEADCMRFFEEMIESLDDSEAESTSSDHAEGRSADSTDGRAAPPPRSAPSPPKSRPPDDSPPQSPTLAHGDPPSARLQNQHQGLARLRYRPPTGDAPSCLCLVVVVELDSSFNRGMGHVTSENN